MPQVYLSIGDPSTMPEAYQFSQRAKVAGYQVICPTVGYSPYNWLDLGLKRMIDCQALWVLVDGSDQYPRRQVEIALANYLRIPIYWVPFNAPLYPLDADLAIFRSP